MPSPPPYYVHTMPLPPPYSPTSAADKPPDYEVVLLNNGRCLYRRTESETAESDVADEQRMVDSSQDATI